MALGSSTLAHLSNPQASAVHYRISTILFHSGVKHDDLKRLNHLGVCMFPDSIVRLQGKINMQLEGKVDIWKSGHLEKCYRRESWCPQVTSKEEAVGGRVNSMALAPSTLARLSNPQASAVHYRISTILFHRCAQALMGFLAAATFYCSMFKKIST